jgi:hypothetical protein
MYQLIILVSAGAVPIPLPESVPEITLTTKPDRLK